MKWVIVRGFPDYEINSLGIIRRVTGRRRGTIGLIKKPFVIDKGYHQTHLYKDGKRKRFFIHTLVAQAFLPPKPSIKHEVAHIDGDAGNPAASNLCWKTHKENEEDKLRHGTLLHGEDVGTSKLTVDDVVAIKRKLKYGLSQAVIAKEYGVCQSSISNIKIGRRWKHV